MGTNIPNLVTVENMRAAYNLLGRLLFASCNLPKNVRFVAKRLKKHHGYYICHPHTIVMDTNIKSVAKLFQVMAHEMCHVALEKSGYCDHEKHDHHFQALAAIVCHEMGWKRGSV